MHRLPTGWSRIGNGGFAPVPQIDTPDEHDNGYQQQRRVTPGDFKSQVRQVLQRRVLEEEQEHDHRSVKGSVHSSPAFSDTALIGGDYLDVPIHHYDEVNLGGDYIEYHEYYAPQVAGLTPSIKASDGLEVCSGPSYLSPGGFHVDDPLSDLSYRGSEGKIEEVPGEPQNYKPPALRSRFLLILFLILVTLVGLAEVAIKLLPNDSGTTAPSQVLNDTVEIRPRSIFVGRTGLYKPVALFKRQNSTTPSETTSVTSTESSSASTSSTIPKFPGHHVSTSTIETPVSSTTAPIITWPPEIPPSASSTPLTDPPLPLPSTTSSSLPLSFSSTVSQAEPPPPPPLPPFPPPPPPPAASTSSEDKPSPPEIPSAIPSFPGEQWPSHTLDPSTFTSITNPDGTAPPIPPSTSSTDPNNPPSPSLPAGPPNPEPTHSDPSPTGSTAPLPTDTPSSFPPPTSTLPKPPSSLPSPPNGPVPDPPSDATTLSSTSTFTTETLSTITGSTSPDSPTESMRPTEQSSSGISSSVKSTSMPSTITTTHPVDTNALLPASSTPKPFSTITIVPDTQPLPPLITTTITTSVSQLTGLPIETTFVSIINNVKAFADDDVVDIVSVYKDSHGKPTRTTTIHAQRVSVGTSLVVLYNPMETTLTDYQGIGTKTQDYYISSSTRVFYDKNHRPTATEISTITETLSLMTLTDSNGVPTKTKTELVPMSSTIVTTVVLPTSTASSSSKENKALHVVPISNGQYFLGLMFPTFIAIMVSIPIRIIDQNARLYQPFNALVSSRGAKACDTLCFPTTSTLCLAGRIRALLNGQILLTLTGLLVLGSVIMIPLSSEAVGIILEGPDCATATGDTLTCSMALGVYSARAQIAVALLALMAVIVGLSMVVLRKWKTGVKENPWSLFRMVHLAANDEIKLLVRRRLRKKNGHISNSQLNEAFKGRSFVLSYWNDNGDLKYSILIPNGTHSSKKDGKTVAFKKGRASQHQTKGDTMPFFILTWTGRLLFLGLLCAMDIGLLVYTIAGEGQGYTEFMTGRWRIVRFIFTLFGVIISLIWDDFFQAVAFLSPHKLFHRIRLYHGDAGKMTPPTNAFSGIRSSLKHERQDIYLGIVSATSILSEILPLLLSVALDKCTETFWAHTVCLWMAVCLLSIMILTIAGSFFVSWPDMPIDPSLIAGGIYYALTKYMPMSPSSGLLFGRVSPGLV
ncbi:uncharacterized protein GGS22DRAFT_136374 [Annulohypoxylon maeteangense]|uniref:uncharacterized protein n=1 Tax=Annulohypoxylon maeteangense TaxID=1927788 RepID=UPI00200845DE|nr:uncharacterized protein GGS22DRAFT_136374 [Annulohypoxylon maeteangense]KAI0884944.1 hypothetical protein GGS22DRAFT_136374 [Annulohypoxylon maeteangense]